MQATIGQRIRQKRKELKLTQQDLARKMKDVSHVAISQWESNTTKPNAENLYELSMVLGCDFGWLLKGEGTNVSAAVNLDTTKIPIISYEQLKNWDVSHPLDINQESEFIMTSTRSSESAFALKIIGDAMAPDFIEGDVIVIDPTIQPQRGEFILAKCNDAVYFRKYRIDHYNEGGGLQFVLSPINGDYASLSSMQNDIVLIGTMVEHRIYRRKR